ncbi:hypothetical protein TNCV_494911 [Trichonephila clavipes]|nr:hypothetical protein TNCV_494911 [Trichonephila clavipes]
MREVNHNPTRFQVKKDGVDSSETCITGDFFYKNRDSSTEFLQNFQPLKQLRKDLLSSQGRTNMINKCEATGTSGAQPGRGQRC